MNMEKKSNFVKDIEPNFYATVDENAFEMLFKEYERVIFRSIVTSFGLDIFIRDQYGGDVDTILNVRKIGTDPDMEYKNEKNSIAYDERGDYSHKNVEGKDTNFQRIKHKAREQYHKDNSNTVRDAYEDKELHFLGKSKNHPTDRSAELDHVISAKSIHDDRGRVLAGCSTKDLADREENLQWTNEHLNKSMGADEIPDYIEKHPELPDDVKQRMMDAYNQSKAAYEAALERNYYFNFSNPNCRQFYIDTATSAGKRGLEMGIRQALGFLMIDLWFSIKETIRISDGTARGCAEAIVNGLDQSLTNAKRNYKHLFSVFGEGLLSGIFASLTTTLCNIFFTTSKNLGRIIRQTWSSIVEATSLLFFNKDQEYFCDRMTSAAKVLAAGASVVIGTGVQETIAVKLSEFSIPEEIRNILSTFAGSLCTGLLSVTLLFYIDNDPFNKFIENVYGQNVIVLKAQVNLFEKYCAELENINLENIQYETMCIKRLVHELDRAYNADQVKESLNKTRNQLGIPCLWENSTLDQKMNDKNWILTF